MALLTCLLALATGAPVDTDVHSLMVFKNGYGFVSERGEAALDDGWVELPEAPQASFGLLWLGIPEPGYSIDRAVSSLSEEAVAAEVGSIDDLLVANVGARVTLVVTANEGEREVQGVLGQPLLASQPVPLGPTYYGDPPLTRFAVPPTNLMAPAAPPALEYVTLVGDDGSTTLVPKGRVLAIQFAEAPRRTRTETKQAPHMRALVTRGGEPGGQGQVPVQLTYMRKGVSWLPSYRVARLDDGTARVRLDATLINDVADLEGADVGFIVGVPSFILQDMLSPASVRMAWEGLSPYFGANAGGGGGYAQIMVTQMANVAPLRTAEAPSAPNPLEGMDVGAGAQEDLYVYRIQDVDMPQGGRGLFKVMEADVPYEEVYLLTLTEEVASRFDEVSERIEDPELVRAMQRPDVWHALRLRNTTEGPWTTGAAATLSADGMPVGQSMMTFTPPGSTVDLKLTVSPDVTASRDEREISRKSNVSINNREWTLVTVRGTLTVSNSRSAPVRVIARRQVVGSFSEVSEPGTSYAIATSVYSVNPTSEALWDITVPPGGATDLTFSYTVYVR